MLPSQRQSPLKQEQREKQTGQQRIADVIDQGNFWHGPGGFAVILQSGDAQQQRADVGSFGGGWLGPSQRRTIVAILIFVAR